MLNLNQRLIIDVEDQQNAHMVIWVVLGMLMQFKCCLLSQLIYSGLTVLHQ